MNGQYKVLDCFKQEINPQDFVVFRLTGRSGVLHYGKVTKLDFETDSTGNIVLNGDGNPYPIAFVRQALKSYGGGYQIAKRPSRLTNMEGMVVFDDIPKEIEQAFFDAGL